MSYIPDVWGDRRVQAGLGVAALVGLGAGTALGYILTKRKLKKRFTTFNVFNEVKTGDVNPNQLSLGFDPEGVSYSLVIPNDPEEAVVIVPTEAIEMVDAEEVESVEINTVLVDDSEWNYEAELASRTSRTPYVIHQEEFIENETDFRQETLNYYAGDDIMVDPADTPIYGYSDLLGELKFGHGSKDPNVVYIRNESIRMEWEVLLNPGHYSVEVLGLTMEQDAEEELRHSHTSVRKFRGD